MASSRKAYGDLCSKVDGLSLEKDYTRADSSRVLKKLSSRAMCALVRSEGLRSDGRDLTTVRPIDIDMAPLPTAHGSVVFTRGETQSLATCTLGDQSMQLRVDDALEPNTEKRFYLQYAFPPSSVGETGRTGAPGRREVGHGALAEKALRYALPDAKTFPYSMRVESLITESCGSSSMASVCGGCLALLDAGVPLTTSVAGVAMGVLLDDVDDPVVLTDILGIEDALGGMDFKVEGRVREFFAKPCVGRPGCIEHAIEQASRRWRGGRRDDAARRRAAIMKMAWRSTAPRHVDVHAGRRFKGWHLGLPVGRQGTRAEGGDAREGAGPGARGALACAG